MMPLLVEDLPAQPAPAANVEQEARLVGRQREELDRAVGHFRLDGLDARAVQGSGVWGFR